MIMKVIMSLILVASFITAFSQNQGLDQVFKIQQGLKSVRVGSYDRSGGNNDRMENIKVGERRVIMDVQGAGIINHIWITIAPRPEKLNRSDIIIRMYWDGYSFPSVESPIGPFFGQGWDESYNYWSAPLSVGPDNGTGMVSYFKMPFSKGAKILTPGG